MSAHDDAVEAAGRYIHAHSPMSWLDSRRFGEAVVDAVEPIIRADEQEKHAPPIVLNMVEEINRRDDAERDAVDEYRERLRAQVEALRDEYDESPYPYTHNALNRVLALLDGEPNG